MYWSSSAAMSFTATLSLYSGSYSLIPTQKQMVMAYPSPHPHWYKYLRELPLSKLIKCSLATLSLYSGSYSLIPTQKQMVMAYPSPHPHWYKYLRELPLSKLIKCSLPFAYHQRWIPCGYELYTNANLLTRTANPEVNVLLPSLPLFNECSR